MKLRHHLQEWAADRFDWVQYPHIRQVKPIKDSKPEPLLNFGQALGILVIGCAAVIFGLLMLAFVFFFFLPALFD